MAERHFSVELYHHGIKGQKWGVRRFQNSNGSYTSAGRKRYHKGESRPERLNPSETDSAVTKKVKKNYNQMTDQEFMNKYQVSKNRYARSVAKYGDPYMNGKLARLGKKLQAQQNKPKDIRRTSPAIVRRDMKNLTEAQFNKKYGIDASNMKRSKSQAEIHNDNAMKANQIVQDRIKKDGRLAEFDSKYKNDEYYWDRYKETFGKEMGNITRKLDRQSKKNNNSSRQEAKRRSDARALFKKYPQLVKDFGSPNQIDDWDFFDLVVAERGYKK